MEIPLFDMGGTPQPREKVKIESVQAVPYPDRFRVWVELKVTPFQERPNLILTLHDDADRMVAELNVIETMHANMEFTMHLRGVDDPAGAYALSVELFYETRNPPHDSAVVGFMIPAEAPQPPDETAGSIDA